MALKDSHLYGAGAAACAVCCAAPILGVSGERNGGDEQDCWDEPGGYPFGGPQDRCTSA